MGKEITFIRDNGLSPFEIKLARTLRKQGYEINSVTFNEMPQEHKEACDKNIYFLREEQKYYPRYKKLFCLPKFILSLKKIRKSTLIGITSSSNWFVTIMFLLLRKRAQCTIYFPYDVAYFRYKDYKTYRWYDRFCEKYNFKHSDGIIHKGPEDQSKYLPKEFKAYDKPTLQFLPYCDKDLFIDIDDKYFKNKLSVKDGVIHLVYVGIVPHNDPIRYPFLDVFKDLIKHKMHVYVYATNYEQIFNDKEYKELQKNNYFKLYKPIYGKSLQGELSKYDWGLTPIFYIPGKFKEEWIKVCTGSKMSTYLEAGLPMLLNDELSFYVYLIEKNEFGKVIKPWSGIKVKEVIKSINYKKMVDDIKVNRSKFTLDGNIDRLISFIKNLADK